MQQHDEQTAEFRLPDARDTLDRVTRHLDILNDDIENAVYELDTLVGTIEAAKREKRTIRAAGRGRKLTDPERTRIQSLDALIAETDILRKAQMLVVRYRKWTAAEYANQWVDAQDAYQATLNAPLIHDLPTTPFGPAEFVGEYEVNSPAWHAARTRGIGGSDIPAIMGTSPFQNRARLFEFKTGQRHATGGKSSAMALGDAYESYIQRRFALAHPTYRVFHTKGSWRSTRLPYQLANVDGLYASDGGTTPDGILEIKNVSHPEEWVTAPPLHYRQQILWYMDTFGLTEGRLAALINSTEYREFEIRPEPGEMEAIHAAVAEFYAQVEEHLSKSA